MPYSAEALFALLPELIGAVFLLVVLMVGVFLPGSVRVVGGLAAAGAAAVFAVATWMFASGFHGTFFGGGYVVDGFALYFKLLVAGCAFLTVVACLGWARSAGDATEYLVLILSVMFGATLLVSMRDLFGVFLGLELSTIPSYALVAFDRRRRESSEGAMKYIITGAVASSVLLYGIVLIYGTTGSASLPDVAKTFSGPQQPAALLGLLLLISGFAFKVSAAPFHFWTPDAYQGAPATTAAFISVAPKMATFAVLLRVLTEGAPGEAPVWTAVLAVIAIVTMFAGNLPALRQTNVRRMLAYSSVAHSGYVLTAFAAWQGGARAEAVQAVMIYAVAYAVMNLGAFLVIDIVGEDAKSFNGLVRTRPGLAASMFVFMAALVGIPPLSGFWGKLWVILSGAGSGSVLTYVTVGALVVSTVISVPYYFGIVRGMLFEEPVSSEVVKKGEPAGLRLAVHALAFLTLIFFVGIAPLSAVARAAGML